VCRLRWVPHVDREKLDALYKSHYFIDEMGFDYLGDEVNIRADSQNLLRFISQFVTNGRLLDIGSAYGFLIDEARNLGWEVHGVEAFEGAVRHSRDQLGLPVDLGFVEDLQLSSQAFDAVTLVRIIEHFPCPLKVLSDIKRLLRPNGLVAIITVDTSCFPWLYRIKPPEHLYYFDRRNLRMALEQHGFFVEHESRYWSWFNIKHYAPNALRTIVPVSQNSWIHKMIPGIRLKLPTNEMLVIARKKSS